VRNSPATVTARPYRSEVNKALVQWLRAPEAEGVRLTLEDFLGRPEWHQLASCRGMGHGAFVRGEAADYGPTRELCAGCPVRQECLEAALADSDLVGLWGGTTDRERREMRRSRVA
jgi:WhiB family redox-sensing transcriptional regulator